MLRRTLTSFIVLSSLLFAAKSNAGLSGFTAANPYTQAELSALHHDFPENIKNYRDAMRENVIMLSKYAKSINPNFIIMAHEGQDLLHDSLWEFHLDDYNQSRRFGYSADRDTLFTQKQDINNKKLNTLSKTYVQNIDAEVLNNLYCQPDKHKTVIKEPIQLFSIDYCRPENLDDAIKASVAQKTPTYIFTNAKYAFKDAKNQLLINENAVNIENLSQAKNILFLLDTKKYRDKEQYLTDIGNSNFDMVVISPFFKGQPLTKEDVNRLKYKKNGTLRKIIAALNISETDNQKYYWRSDWKIGSPSWLKRASFVDKEGIIVEYWSEEWQKILSNYFKGIVMQEFDGAFFTGLDNYRYFEQQTPLE